MKIRAEIEKRAKLISDLEPDLVVVQVDDRARATLKRSRPVDNIEGRTEADLKEQSKQDKAPGYKYKKRHRKDLTAEVIEAIVAATREPFRLHKDVAQQFRVTAHLVSALALEAQRKPERLQALR